ncbi:N-acetylmuramoyl-L-alanine amidase [Pseudoflavonifractor sp. 60]|uniref:peptidoglycan recognition protein family protein n=1 Tax=Pseudoflavonifractor sp. 60 TaxID=2304576 RepID=UPI00136AE288|nr:peptidoglycan recognition family protein [Pseudoflavonifractor sp. 60]MCI8431462.1 N-acetylmuramoyl-L-alanine amidase [Lachnospiraceae bacterium]NBI68544.1 N-acetylmuramoyl-L-alanine amidase [Pseudoflavonifractor sp. 60]
MREFPKVWLLLLGFCAAGGVVLALCVTASLRLPEYVDRELNAGERAEVIGRNSPLIDYIWLSPSADFPRQEAVTKLTIHHMAGDLSLEQVGEVFSQRDRRSSANYGIDSQGQVGLYVEESNRAWTSSSSENDSQAVTIEVANDEIGGDWHVSDQAYETLLELCTDICRRNHIEELRFTGDETGNLTLHSMFSSETECPGPYLKSRMGELAAEVNWRLMES